MKITLLILGFLAGTLLFVSRLHRGLVEAPANAVWPTYRRVDWWILSAQCTQSRRVLLVACGPQNRLYPIEDVSPTDDRGHGLVANLVALFQTRPFDKVDMVRINVWINAAAIALLALILGLCGMPWASFLCLMAGAQYGLPGPMASADAQATFIGEFCLVLTPIPWMVQRVGPKVPRWRLGLSAALSGAALIAATLLREAIGLVGIFSVALFAAIALWESRPAGQKEWRRAIGIWAFLLLALGSNSLMLSVRNRWLSLPPAHLIASHGITHALYLGLGTEENPWGIRFEDPSGAEAVKKIDPHAFYGTPAYYSKIGRIYGAILVHHPVQVGIIYGKKFVKTLALPIFFGGISIFWYALAAALALPFLLAKTNWPRVPLWTAAAMEITVAIFLLQGVIIVPSPMFLYPAKFGVLMVLIGLADAAMSYKEDGSAWGRSGKPYC